MKTVRIDGAIVVETIPDYALPVGQWYGPAFAAQCIEAPDEAEQGWAYCDGVFSAPTEGETAQDQIAALKEGLSATDYQAIKYAEGWITEAEYAPVKAQRQHWRDEINRLEGLE